MQRTAGNRAATQLVQRAGWADYAAGVSGAAASDASALAKLAGFTQKDLELLEVEDLRRLWGATRRILTPELERARAHGTLPPIGVEMGKDFLQDVLEPALAAKLQGGEVARLFWPLVEHVMANLGDRPLAAFLNVLPTTKTYVSDGTGAGPPAGDLSANDALQMGVPGVGLDVLLTDWASEAHEPSDAEARSAISATFVNVPRAIAKVFFEVVSQKEALKAFKAERAVEGHAEEIRSRAEQRVEALGKRLVHGLGALDKHWFNSYHSFSQKFGQESTAAAEAPGVRKAFTLLTGPLTADPTTVTSCYMAAVTSVLDYNPFAPDIGGHDLETPAQRFQRALKAMTTARGPDTSDLSPLTAEIWEAKLEAGVWVDVEIRGERDEKYMVHPVGLSSEHHEVVPLDRLRPKQRWSKGDQVMIDWDGVFHPGKVLDTKKDQVSVHWYGQDASAPRRWIDAARLRPLGA